MNQNSKINKLIVTLVILIAVIVPGIIGYRIFHTITEQTVKGVDNQIAYNTQKLAVGADIEIAEADQKVQFNCAGKEFSSYDPSACTSAQRAYSSAIHNKRVIVANTTNTLNPTQQTTSIFDNVEKVLAYKSPVLGLPNSALVGLGLFIVVCIFLGIRVYRNKEEGDDE